MRLIAVRIAASVAILFVLLFGGVAPFPARVNPVIAGTQDSSLVQTFIDGEGREIVAITVNGKPPETTSEVVNAPEPSVQVGINVLPDVPAFDWSYGCSATSAAMLFGYYDRTGYSNIYVGSTNGGVCPLDNSIWGDTAYPSVTCHECPLSATHQGVDGLATKGHVDDYWIDYGNVGPDPYIGNWAEHAQGSSTGDFMGTNQSKFSISDGGTTFYFYPNGDPLYDYTGAEPAKIDGCHGMKDFAVSRGYGAVSNFNQYIQGQGTDLTKGFTFSQYVAEIDAGRPVLIQVRGHTMLGYGYDTTGGKIYVRDTWDHSSHQMTWGGTYSGMQHYGVTVLRLAGGSTLPSVTTSDASNVAASSARLNGNLTSLGTASSVSVSFQWGTSPGSYSTETTSQTKTVTGVFSSDLGSLSSGATYYFRTKAVGNGTSYGTEKSFTTSTVSPLVTTNSATNISTSSASLNGNLSSLGSASSDEVSFQWGASPGIYLNETTLQTMTAVGVFSFNITDLDPGTTYYFRAKAVGHGASYGDESSFATLTTPPSVTTSDAASIAATSATLNGDLTNLGTASGVNVSFQWGTSPGFSPSETTVQVMTTTGPFNYGLVGLSPVTTYYYRAKVVGHGTAYGAEKSFTTLTAPPSVPTNDANNITTNAARLNGSLTSLGSASTVNVSFEWGTSPGSYPNESTPQVMTTTGVFSFDLSTLTPGTTYYFRAKAIGDGTSYGDEKSFIASTTPPAVNTTNVTDVAVTSAKMSGNLTSLGTAAIVNGSFQWGISPGVYSNETASQAITAAGSFSIGLTGLQPGITYYFRAKVVGHGTSYGVEASFITLTTPPSVIAIDATDITTDKAIMNANLVSLGTAETVSVAFLWGTTPGGPYPNQATSQSTTTDGTISVGVDELTPGTTYYYVVEATGNGSAFAAEKSFATLSPPPSVDTGDTDVTPVGTMASTAPAEPFHWPLVWSVIGVVGVLGSIAFFLVKRLSR